MLRPLHDWLLVKVDPFKQKFESIWAPDTTQRIRTAIVLDTGKGKVLPNGVKLPCGVEKGEKVAFFREHLEHQQGKQLVSTLKELGDDLALLRVADVLFVIDGEIEVSDGSI